MSDLFNPELYVSDVSVYYGSKCGSADGRGRTLQRVRRGPDRHHAGGGGAAAQAEACTGYSTTGFPSTGKAGEVTGST